MKNSGKNFSSIIISITALLAILLVGAGITYSWIEGGTSYTIQTENENDVKTATAPSGNVYNAVTLDPSSSEKIDLTKIDANTGKSNELIFSPVSSADGENFFFAAAYDEDGVPARYRAYDTNDVGTKFIKYEFDVTASKKCYLSFEEAPKITRTNGSELTDEELAAFRIMIKSGGESKILNLTDKNISDTSVTDVSGDTQSVTAESVNNYIFSEDHTKKLFEYNANDTDHLTVSVWLDGARAESSLIGSEVKLDMNLKVASKTYKVKIYVEPRGYSDYYAYGYNDAETEFPFGSWSGTQMTADGDTGYSYISKDDITDNFNFIVNNNAGNQYPAQNSPTKLTIDVNQTPNEDGYITYVLKNDNMWRTFDDTKITVNARACYFNADNTPKTESSADCGTVQAGDSSAGTSSKKAVYYDDGTGSVELKASAKAHYTFEGWYSNEACTNLVSNDETYAYSVSDKTNTDVTLYAKFTERPKYDVSVSAITYDYQNNKVENGFTGGSFTVGTTEYTALYENQYYSDENVTATANANEHYTFAGWYSDSDCSVLVSNNAKLDESVSGSRTFYAKFEEDPKYTINVQAVTFPLGTAEVGGTVSINSSTASYAGYSGETVTLNAAANSGFRFDGWYSDDTCSDKIDGDTVTISEALNGTTYYAKFMRQYTVSFIARTDGNQSSDGGQVRMYPVGGTAPNYAASQTMQVDANTTIVLDAQQNRGCLFNGIYRDEEPISPTLTATAIIDSDTTFYADFITNTNYKTTTIYFEPISDYGKHYAYVYGDACKEQKDWPGDELTLDEATGYYKYEFEALEDEAFYVIVNDNGSRQYPPAQQTGLTGQGGKTYLFRSGTPTELEEFDPSTRVNVSINAVTYDSFGEKLENGFTGGSITVGGNNYTAEYSGIYTIGTSVTATAAANSGYTFEGWYSDEDCTVSVSTAAALSQSVTSSANYYAKFTKTESTSKGIYLKPELQWNTGGERYAMYVFDDSGKSEWISMESVGNGYYRATVPEGNYKNVIFVRMDGSTTENNWDNKWDQTADLLIPNDNNNCYTATKSTWNGSTSGSWGVYPY